MVVAVVAVAVAVAVVVAVRVVVVAVAATMRPAQALLVIEGPCYLMSIRGSSRDVYLQILSSNTPATGRGGASFGLILIY